jgi:hypothetical protein
MSSSRSTPAPVSLSTSERWSTLCARAGVSLWKGSRKAVAA